MKIQFKQAHAGNFKAGRSQEIEYIVLHYTANRGDTAKNNADYFAGGNHGAGAHYFVDEKEIWQSVKDCDTAYHVGAKAYVHPDCRNANSIGVEMCDSVDSVPAATEQKAVELVRQLMQYYHIPADHVLRHYDVTHKLCPAPWVSDTGAWAAFQKKLVNVTKEEAKKVIKIKAGLSDATMTYLDSYRYGDELLVKLAKAMQ